MQSRCKIFRKDEKGNDLPPEDEQFLCYVFRILLYTQRSFKGIYLENIKYR